MKLFKDSKNNVFCYMTEPNDDWLVDKIEITQSEFDAANAAYFAAAQKDYFNKMTYGQKRATEYPDIKEFCDAWVKNDDVALEVYRQKCLAVKAKYPKPTA